MCGCGAVPVQMFYNPSSVDFLDSLIGSRQVRPHLLPMAYCTAVVRPFSYFKDEDRLAAVARTRIYFDMLDLTNPYRKSLSPSATRLSSFCPATSTRSG